MASIFIPRTGTTAISTAIFSGLKGFSPFRFPPISLPAPGRGFPPSPPIKISSPNPRIGKMTFKKPVVLGRSSAVLKPFVPGTGIKAEPITITNTGVGVGIPTVPLQKTSGVIQSGGSGVGRLKSTLSFAFTPEGKLNIPLLALLLAAAGLILKK